MDENKKLGQEAAFSRPYHVLKNMNEQPYGGQKGISKRFYAACAAMQGMLSNQAFISNSVMECKENANSAIIKVAYEFADELLKQENL